MSQEAPALLGVPDEELERRRQALSTEVIWGNHQASAGLQAVEAELSRRRQAREERLRLEAAATREAAWRRAQEREAKHRAVEKEAMRRSEEAMRRWEERIKREAELGRLAEKQVSTARALDETSERLVALMRSFLERETKLREIRSLVLGKTAGNAGGHPKASLAGSTRERLADFLDRERATGIEPA